MTEPFKGIPERWAEKPSQAQLALMAADNLVAIVQSSQGFVLPIAHHNKVTSVVLFEIKGFQFEVFCRSGWSKAQVEISTDGVRISEQKAAEILAILARPD